MVAIFLPASPPRIVYWGKRPIIISDRRSFNSGLMQSLLVSTTFSLLVLLVKYKSRDLDKEYVEDQTFVELGVSQVPVYIQTEIFIGINLGKSAELAKSVTESWGAVLQGRITVGFFACTAFNASLPIVFKEASYPCNEYPPTKSLQVSLQIMSRFERVKWFLICDDDSYVNVRGLVDFLDGLARLGVRHDDPLYFGSPGYGREKEWHLLGLQNRSYAMGGPCAGLSAGAMRALRPILADCMRWPAARQHSDTQLGRCMQALNISLHLPAHTDRSLRRAFRHVYGGTGLHLDGSVVTPFAASTVSFPLLPHELAPPPITLHCIKEPLLMHRLHAQLHHGATPITADRALMGAAACVHNPAVARAVTACGAAPGERLLWSGTARHEAPAPPVADNCSVSPPECPVPRPAAVSQGTLEANLLLPVAIASAYVLCRRGRACDRGPAFRAIAALGVQVEAVAVAEAGFPAESIAVVLLSALPRIQSASTATGQRRGAVLVLDGDAELSPAFAMELAGLPAQRRCWCPLAVAEYGCTPGVLLLGAAPSHPAVQLQYAAEVAGLHAGGAAASTQCVNALPATGGKLALLVAVEVLPLALGLLKADPGQPLERFLLELSLVGLPVRAAWPPLIV